MNNKLLTAMAGILACAAMHAQAPAAAPAAAPSVSFTATASVVSQYMFRGQRLNGAGFQPSIEMAAGDFTAGVWGNFVLDSQVPDSSDPEIDVYGSYTLTLGKDLTLVPGFTAYFYPKAPTSAGYYRSTFEPSLALNYTFEGVKVSPKIYYDTVLDGATYELSAAYAVPLKDVGSELDFTATAGTYKLKDTANETTPAVKSWGDYWLLGVSMPFQLSKTSKLSLGYAYTEGRNAFTKQGTLGRAPNSLAVGRGVVTVGYALSF
jgi:uncharacterized protein (TIGR02001 family)